MSLTFNPRYNYVRRGNGLSTKECFMRFVNVTIPVGSQIIKAYLAGASESVMASVSVFGRIVVHFVDADDASSPTTEAQFIALSLTSGQEVSSFFGGTYTPGESQDIAAELQKIIDRPGWVSGNSVVMVIKNGLVSGSPVNLDLVSKDAVLGLTTPYTVGVSMSRNGEVIFLGYFHDSPKISVDGGISWATARLPLVFPNGLGYTYYDSFCDYDGSVIACVHSIVWTSSKTFVSTDSGNLWGSRDFDKIIYKITGNQGGSILYTYYSHISAIGSRLYKSVSGGQFAAFGPVLGEDTFITDVVCNASGSFIAAPVGYGSHWRIYTSTNYGESFSSYNLPDVLYRIQCSSTGQYIFGYSRDMTYVVFVSSNYGASFLDRLHARSGYCYGTAMSDTGNYMMACFATGKIFISSNYGVDWAEKQPAGVVGVLACTGISCNSTGSKIVACFTNFGNMPAPISRVYISEDFGETWSVSSIGSEIRLEPHLVVDYVSEWINLT